MCVVVYVQEGGEWEPETWLGREDFQTGAAVGKAPPSGRDGPRQEGEGMKGL